MSVTKVLLSALVLVASLTAVVESRPAPAANAKPIANNAALGRRGLVDRAAMRLENRGKLIGRSDKRSEIITPKIVIISMFSYEASVWYKNFDQNLYAINITVPGFSPLYPDVHCTSSGEVCQLVTGESEINAASTITALVHSSYFNLTSTYFMIAGIAGINPYYGTLGSVAFSRFAIQFGLEYEFDAREITSNFTTGYVPLGALEPTGYPGNIYGTEVFELNLNLRARAVYLAKLAKLNDSSDAIAYRARYDYAPANLPPSVIECDAGCSDVYYSGHLLSESFGNYTELMTNGSGKYCMTAQEDNATLEAMLRGAVTGLVDFSRIILMRTGSDFDRAPPGVSSEYHLLYAEQGGFSPAIANIFLTGNEIVKDVLKFWDTTYKGGITPGNYIGDILNTLDSPYGFAPDFGTPLQYIN